MAGTDSSRSRSARPGPAIILVEPQLGENIGMVARAMLNCGLTRLRLVTPREPWPSAKAVASASGADVVLESASVFETTSEAISDLRRVYAATARSRDMTKPVLTNRQLSAQLRDGGTADAEAGVLFGKEAKGLTNDDVALADAIVRVPLNPAFCSLNLAMAVLLVGYEWFQQGDQTPPEELTIPKETRPAAKGELVGFFEQLEAELDACGFLHVREKRPIMVRNIRNLFGRAALTEQEVRTLRGIVSCLVSRRRP